MSFDLAIKNGDLFLGQDSDVSIVVNSNKLIQDILKGISTPIGSNQFFQNYGTVLGDLSISGISDQTFIETSISMQIENLIDLIKTLQNQQITNGQKVSPTELVDSIQNLKVNRNTVDPTYLSVILVVLTKAFKDAIVTFGLNT